MPGTPEGLSLVLPVFNQAPILEKVLSSWSLTLEKIRHPYEIILVDDGSTDETRPLIESNEKTPGLARRFANLRVVGHPERRGYGACLRTALGAAQHPLFFYTGCDYAYDPADIRTLLHRIGEPEPETGNLIDLVNGYRTRYPLTGWRRSVRRVWGIALRLFLDMEPVSRPGWLGAAAHRYALVLRLLFGVRIGDVDSKFKLLRRRIFDVIDIQSDGEFVHAEILAKANFMGCLMDELPIAQRSGPFPARLEPPSLRSRWREGRVVFSSPAFRMPSTIRSARAASGPPDNPVGAAISGH